MKWARNFYLMASLPLVGGALPCVAQGVGGLGAPTPQDTLEMNLNALRGPSPGAPQRVDVPTPQRSLDNNIDSLRPGGAPRDRPTPQYYPPETARGTYRHPGADALLYGTGTTLAPINGGHRRKARAGRRKGLPRP